MFCLSTCAGQGHNGTVILTSAGKSYTPFSNLIYSYDNKLSMDAARLYPKDLTEKNLECILVDDTASIELDGQLQSEPTYTLYNEAGEEVCYRQTEFSVPTESGKYWLCIEVAWGNENKYDGYQYFFYLTK